jgi:integrase
MKKDKIVKILKGSNYLKKMKLYVLKTSENCVKIRLYHNGKYSMLDLPALSISNDVSREEMLLLERAMSMRDEMEANAGGIVVVADNKKKASECFDEWVAHYQVRHSQINAALHSRHFLEANGDMPIKNVARNHIMQSMDRLRQTKVCSNYVRDHGSRIRAFCNWCEQKGYLGRIDTRKLLPPERFGEVKRLSEDEIARLAATPAEECPDVKDLFMLGIYTVQRLGEMKQYTFSLLQDGEIRGRQGKTGKFIVVKLSKPALKIIERLKERRLKEGLGVSAKDKIFRLPCKRTVKRVFDKWMTDAGVELGKVYMKNCRSTSISVLINRGVPESVTQELANHADIRTTSKYYRQIDSSRKKEALDKIPEF